MELVWAEATSQLLELMPTPMDAEPEEVLVASGLATRRAWLRHYRLAPYVAATPEGNRIISDAVGLMASVFERLGLEEDRVAAAFHTYSSFMLGAVLFAASRLLANEQLEAERDGSRRDGGFRAEPAAPIRRRSTERTRLAMDEVMEVSVSDPARDEELFAEGLRRLVKSLR